MNPRASIAIVAAVAVGSAGIGWVAGRQIKSPADLAADAAAPEASLITVPVELVALSSDVVIRGQVEFSESTDITPTASSGGANLVTRLPKAEGEVLNEGDVVVELAGRPMIALQGELPVFRSFTPGLEGPDVQQLEEALIRVGLDPGTVDGRFDGATEAAVATLYRNLGYTPDEPSAEDLDRVEQARKAVRSAREAVTAAGKAGSQGMSRSERLELDRQVTAAQAAFDTAKIGRDSANATAQLAVKDTAATLAAARLTDTTVATRLTQAEGGAHPDTGVASTPEQLDELRAERTDAAAKLVATDREAQAANAAVPIVAREQDILVADASATFDIAVARRAEAIAAASGGSGDTGLADARAALKEAEGSLARLEAEIGTSFPSSELVFLPKLPNEIQAVQASVGSAPQGPVMTVTGSGVRITSSVAAADRALLVEGAEGVMEDEALGISVPVIVSDVAESPGGADVSAERYAVTLEPIGELPDEALNQNFRVTIPFDSSDGEVLAVPMAALSAGADGSSRVEVERADGTVEIVTVVPGLNARAQGLVEITPVDGQLEEGDRVVVGNNVGASDSDEPDPETDAESGAEAETEEDG